ncbi:MAG: AtpZ/AtpI family protein [Rhizobiaceae bacterium]|nr:AtpZ/AtpI family protein [Rhizobiaceae bacterium]
MAAPHAPGGPAEPRKSTAPDDRGDDLERRRRALEASLDTKRPQQQVGEGARASGKTGYGQAFKLSSEFIAGIAVGAGLGWVIDRYAGTSPWGLIVFLLLGFAAGVLNVLRSAGMVAEGGVRVPPKDGGTDRN